MHQVIAFSSVPLFIGALLSDWAYASSFEIQWTNFAAWLIAAGVLVAGLALLWGTVDAIRSRATGQRLGWTYGDDQPRRLGGRRERRTARRQSRSAATATRAAAQRRSAQR